MKIGIDISQIAYKGTGVSEFVINLVKYLIEIDSENDYILFFSSLRKNFEISTFNFQAKPKNLKIKTFKLPQTVLDIIWNRFHIFPIEWFIGNVDVFISSDWVQPPSKSKKITLLYDLIVYKNPEETAEKIIDVQKRRLKWVKKEIDAIICISDATKKDAMEILGIEENKLNTVYPGI